MSNFNEYYGMREDFDAALEILNFEQELLFEYKKTHPAKGVSKKKRSEMVKRAKRGEDMFGVGKDFKKIEKKASERYGSEDAGKRVAGAIFWKKAKGKHMTNEDVDDLIWIIEDDLQVILDHVEEDLIAEKKWIQKAINPDHKGFCTPITKKTCTPKRKAFALRAKKGDIHQDNLSKD